MNTRSSGFTGIALSILFVATATAQLPKSARLFEQNCLSCHGYAQGQQAPDVNALRQMRPEWIVRALDAGTGHDRAQQLSYTDKVAIAEYLSGRNIMTNKFGNSNLMPNKCPGNLPITSLSASPSWNGWGVDATNGRYQAAKAAGIAPNQVSGLKLKWAFGFPGGSSMYGQPAVVAGRVFIGLNTSYAAFDPIKHKHI